MEPDVVPSPERAAGVAMMACEFLGKVGGLENLLCFGNAGYAEVLNKDVRGEQYESPRTWS
jgi:hypothetical protein